MISKLPISLLVAALISCFAATLPAWAVDAVSASPPRAQQGVIDLRGWDPEEDGLAELRGEWHFAWRELRDPEAGFWNGGGSAGFVDLPAVWNKVQIDGEEVGPTGFASYGLRVLVDPREQPYVISLQRARTAQDLYVNGVLMARVGRVGTDASTSEARRVDQRIAIPARLGQLDLVLHVSNFDFRSGGADKPLQLGLIRHFDHQSRMGSARSFFLIGGFLMLAFYHLIIFFLRPSLKAPLVFAFLNLNLAAYQFTTENEILDWIMPTGSWSSQLRVEYLLFSTTTPLLVLFFRLLYPREVARLYVQLVASATALFALSVFVTSTVTLSAVVLPAYQIWVALVGTYGLVVFANILRRRRAGAIWFFVGLFILFVAFLTDVLLSRYATGFPKLTTIGFTAFLAAQAFMLASFVKSTLQQSEGLAQRLMSLDRLKDEFLASTSHELRTPLHAIIGLADSLRGSFGSRDPDDVDQQLGLIAMSGRRLARLVDDILDFSKLRNRDIALHVKAVDLRAATDVVMILLEPLATRKGLRLENDVPRDLTPVRADEDRLQQILHNLVGNAIRFSESGEISVSASMRGEKQIEIQIRDRGPGIPGERLETIFESFEQIEGSAGQHHGTGLGLTISRRLVELLGGQIWCESSVGVGSVFYFTLPRAVETRSSEESEAKEPSGSFEISSRLRDAVEAETGSLALSDIGAQAAHAESAVNDRQALGDGGRILIVDDDRVNLHVLANYLVDAGHAVRCADGGDDALEQLRAGFEPDLVVLDVMMPRMSGYELCRRLRRRAGAIDLPIVFLTARVQPEDVVAGFEAGGNDFLSKPVAKEELLARIGACLRLKRLASEKVALEQVAFRDALTGLANRRRLELALEEFAESDDSRTISLLFLDLDDFKVINDTHGHGVGDEALKHVAAVLKSCLRNSDLAVRLGGDEFVALLVDADLETADATRSRIDQELTNPVVLDGVRLNISASIGVATASLSGLDVESVLALADQSMYEVKKSRKVAAL